MHLGDRIESQWIDEDVEEGNYIDIIIAEIYDPSKFWIQLKSERATLDQLMNELQ